MHDMKVVGLLWDSKGMILGNSHFGMSLCIVHTVQQLSSHPVMNGFGLQVAGRGMAWSYQFLRCGGGWVWGKLTPSPISAKRRSLRMEAKVLPVISCIPSGLRSPGRLVDL